MYGTGIHQAALVSHGRMPSSVKRACMGVAAQRSSSANAKEQRAARR